MAVGQAARFAATYSVAAQYTDATGLSATVFTDAAGNRYLAIRGTNDGLDLLTDIVDIALLGTTALQSQYTSLKAKVTEWLGDGTLSQSFTVTGHSLGGFLATGIAADFADNVTHTYLYNSPGLGGVTSFVTSPILSALGVTTVYDPAKFSNIKAEAGISPISGLGYQVAPPIYIEIEDQTAADISNPPAARNHSQQVLTDALAVQSLYSKLAPSLGQEQLNVLIDASGSPMGQTLESALDALRVILLGPATAQTAVGDRNGFYTNLYALQGSTAYTALAGAAQLTSFIDPSGKFASDIAMQAKVDNAQGLATRYALVALNPFVLIGADYSTFNSQGELNLYDPVTGTGAITSQYLTDRSMLLERKLWFSTQDKNPFDPSVVFDSRNAPFQNEDAYYEDAASGYKIQQGGLFNNTHHYFFGGEGDDVATGAAVADHLYGGVGDDTLNGGCGNDWLEGGLGYDTYLINPGDGTDTILDFDGQGIIKFGSLEAHGSAGLTDPAKWKQLGADTWVDTRNGIAYSKSVINGETQLLIHKGDSNVLVKGWAVDNLGIVLGVGAAVVEPVTTRTYTGDQRAQLDPNGNYDWGATSWAVGGTLTGGVAEAGFNDVIYGSANADRIDGLGGNDALDGGAGDDRIDGGIGDDLIGGGAGSDFIYGGDGSDVILSANDLAAPQRNKPTDVWTPPVGKPVLSQGGTWGVYKNADNTITIEGGGPLPQDDAPDVVHAGDGEDLVVGGRGNDTLYGEVGNDSLWGNGGNDILDGGAGDDSLCGDGVAMPGLYVTTAESQNGDDILLGGTGKDTLDGGGGNDLLAGGSEDDKLYGGAGNDVLIGGAGHDQFYGGAGEDTYLDFESGIDTLGDLQGRSTILLAGVAGISSNIAPSVATSPDATLAIALDDGSLLQLQAALYGMEASLQFADGKVVDLEAWVSEYLTQSVYLNVNAIQFVDGGAPTRAYGGAGADQLMGGVGDDTLKGYGGSDVVLGYGGDDTLDGSDGDDTLAGGAGSDTLFGGAGTDKLIGDDIDVTTPGDDTLDGGDGNDMLWGQGGNDTLTGSAGDDELQGGDGNDTLTGGVGNDILFGEAGDDTYVFDKGDGNDYLSDTSGANRIIFGAGIEPANLKVTLGTPNQGGQALTITYNAGDSVVLGVGTSAAMHYEFGGQVLDYNGLLQALTTPAYSAQDDSLYGTQMGESLYLNGNGGRIVAGGGNDFLFGGSSNSVLEGGSGDDNLYGGTAIDTLMGGVGNDFLNGGSGGDLYKFGRGDGKDTISDNHANGEINTLQFGPDILAGDVTYVREANGDLSIRINGTSDAVTIKGWYTDASFRLDKIVFGDTSEADLVVLSTLAAPTLVASAPATLRGTDYDDVLLGSTGNDTLIGGLGSDVLSGGDGVDTYVLGWARGNKTYGRADPDIVKETDGGINIIQLPKSLDFSGIDLIQRGNDLYVGLKGSRNVDYFNLNENSHSYSDEDTSPDGMLIKDYFSGGQTWQLQAATGVVVALSDLLQQVSGPPADFRQAAYEDWLCGVKQAVFADYSLVVAEQTGDATFDYVTAYDHHTYSIEYAASASDEPLIQRGSDYNHYIYTQTGTYTVQVSGQNYAPSQNHSYDNGMEVTPIFDYSKIDAGGNPAFLGFAYSNQGMPSGGGQNSGSQTITVPVADIYLAPVVETMHAGSSDNIIEGWSLMAIYGGDGNDTIWTMGWAYSPAGNFLDGGNGNDVVIGTFDNDVILAGNGDDYLAGGGQGDDTYLINPNETGTKYIDESIGVYVSNFGRYYYGGDCIYSTDTIEFAPGLSVNDLTLSKSSLTTELEALGLTLSSTAGCETLDITWGGGAQTLRVMLPTNNTLDLYSGGGYGVEFYKFADGTTLTQAQLLARGFSVHGGSGDDMLLGDVGNDTLIGGAGNDWLEGKAGGDIMYGGLGDDIYIVDNDGDWVNENPGEGIDAVHSSITHVLDQNVENLILTGFDEIDGLGNALNNTISGNDSTNTLVGGGGDDIEYGFGGNDSLNGGSGNDRLYGGAGNDVLSAGSGTSWEYLYGEQGDDRLYGGSSRNYLYGGAGADVIMGGNRNDYLFGGDGIPESASDGDDFLTGNGGADSLRGGRGNDTLYGGTGDDLMLGGTGDDLYRFGRGDGYDSIWDPEQVSGNADKLEFLSGIAADQLWFTHVDDTLEIGVIGTADTVSISGWYSDSRFQIERFTLVDGKALLASQVENLVNAMANFVPPAAGQMTLPPIYQSSLAPIIAANWQ